MLCPLRQFENRKERGNFMENKFLLHCNMNFRCLVYDYIQITNKILTLSRILTLWHRYLKVRYWISLKTGGK